jgi:hypothetical protein
MTFYGGSSKAQQLPLSNEALVSSKSWSMKQIIDYIGSSAKVAGFIFTNPYYTNIPSGEFLIDSLQDDRPN